MSQESQNPGSSKNIEKTHKVIQEQCLKKMESIIAQATQGVHILFENRAIIQAFKNVKDDSDFYDFEKMKMVQDSMTELIAKKSYFEKLAYLQSLSDDSLNLIIRAYFHIVENSILSTHEKH